MSNHEANPGNSNSSAPEQIPHSGVHGFEQPPTRQFDKTPLGEAPLDFDPLTHKGDITTEHLPDDLRVTADKKKKMSRGKKLVIGLAAGVGLGSIVPVYFATQLSAEGPTGPDTQPSASGPVTPGTTEAPSGNGSSTESDVPGFYGEIPSGLEEPIVLTPEQVSAIQSGDWEAQAKVMSEELIPKAERAFQAILSNNGSVEGLDLSNVFGDKKSAEQAEEVVAPLVGKYTYDTDNQIFNVCSTLNTENGTNNFCTPFQQSVVEVGKNITWNTITLNEENREGIEQNINTNMEPHLVNGNQLLITM